MSEWKCSYGKACECNNDAEKSECDLAYKTKKMSKEELNQNKDEKIKETEQLTLTVVSDTLILTPTDAEIFFNEIMNPKEANEALKKAMLKFITR
tara:strand:+ start:995 stop:1279 length:285 start_codon:yes stop_codon:yes gene_type:complete